MSLLQQSSLASRLRSIVLRCVEAVLCEGPSALPRLCCVLCGGRLKTRLYSSICLDSMSRVGSSTSSCPSHAACQENEPLGSPMPTLGEV
eukprot:1671551-Amphidinium_carterae.1